MFLIFFGPVGLIIYGIYGICEIICKLFGILCGLLLPILAGYLLIITIISGLQYPYFYVRHVIKIDDCRQKTYIEKKLYVDSTTQTEFQRMSKVYQTKTHETKETNKTVATNIKIYNMLSSNVTVDMPKKEKTFVNSTVLINLKNGSQLYGVVIEQYENYMILQSITKQCTIIAVYDNSIKNITSKSNIINKKG